MIDSEAVNSSIPLTDILDRAGRSLRAIPGTPLAMLCDATRPANEITGGDAGYTPDVHAITIGSSTEDTVTKVCVHNVLMDEITATAITSIQGQISMARNIVAPAIEELFEGVRTAILARTPASLRSMEVVTWSPPSPFNVEAFQKTLIKFNEVPYLVPPMNFRLKDLAASEILELMLTGSASVDAEIKIFAATKGDTFLLNIWQNVFQIPAALDEKVYKQPSFADFINEPDVGLDNALVIFLLANKLYDAPLPDTPMALPLYEAAMAAYRDQAGASCCRGLEALQTVIDNQQLVRGTRQNTTVVNAVVYDAWIKDGGDNEVLFGNLLEKPVKSLLADIKANADALKSAWKRYAALVDLGESNRRFQITIEMLDAVFCAQMRDVGSDDPTLLNREKVIELFREELKKVSNEDIEGDNLWSVCMRLVCRSRFVMADAEQVLNDIQRYTKKHPEIAKREAAAMAYLDYISRWVASQMKIA